MLESPKAVVPAKAQSTIVLSTISFAVALTTAVYAAWTCFAIPGEPLLQRGPLLLPQPPRVLLLPSPPPPVSMLWKAVPVALAAVLGICAALASAPSHTTKKERIPRTKSPVDATTPMACAQAKRWNAYQSAIARHGKFRRVEISRSYHACKSGNVDWHSFRRELAGCGCSPARLSELYVAVRMRDC